MFKVGDTGKTRSGGFTYTITAVDPASIPARYTATLRDADGKIKTTNATYHPNGQFWGHSEDEWDLLPLPLTPSSADGPAAANCTIVALLLAAGHVTEAQVEAAKRLAEMTR